MPAFKSVADGFDARRTARPQSASHDLVAADGKAGADDGARVPFMGAGAPGDDPEPAASLVVAEPELIGRPAPGDDNRRRARKSAPTSRPSSKAANR